MAYYCVLLIMIPLLATAMRQTAISHGKSREIRTTTGDKSQTDSHCDARAGRDGRDGRDGANGKDGRDGRDGPKGERGQQGDCQLETEEIKVLKKRLATLEEQYADMQSHLADVKKQMYGWIAYPFSVQTSRELKRCGTIQYARRILSTPARQDYHAEAFKINGFTYVMVVSYYDGSAYGIHSIIYRFDGEVLMRYQSVQTDGARDAKYFEMGGQRYLAIAQHYGDRTSLGHKVKSQLYKWNGRKFVHFQALPTRGAMDVEFFNIGNSSFLAFANAYDSSYSTDSHVYKWSSNRFVLFQAIPTLGAGSISFIQLGISYFLAIAYRRTGSTRNTDSKVYRWSGAQFEIFQSIPTFAAHDVEMFTYGSFTFLGFANYYNDVSKKHTIDSKIYIWNGKEFEEFQSIPTIGATDMEVFTVCGKQYVAISNHYGRNSPSAIYEMGRAGLNLYQHVTVDGIIHWSAFKSGNDTFLFGGSKSSSKKSYFFNWVM